MRLSHRHRQFGIAYVLAVIGLVFAPSITIEGEVLRPDVRAAVMAPHLELAFDSAQESGTGTIAVVPRRGSAHAVVGQPNGSAPARVSLPRIGIDGPVATVGIGPDRQLDVPLARTAGWYRHSSIPETVGAAVIAAHVDFNGQPGLFFDLRLAVEGDKIRLELSDGRQVDYEVTAVNLYDKSELPADQLFRSDGEHSLHLVTCGGSFDRFARSYRGNRVVTAVPVAA
ncbi:MAG: class F sortase [Acidimicrobiia bacterium]|nr:class F sortase [Acidimicrobiia bacterium]